MDSIPSVAFARAQWWPRAGGTCAQKPHTMSAIDVSSSRVLLNKFRNTNNWGIQVNGLRGDPGPIFVLKFDIISKS